MEFVDRLKNNTIKKYSIKLSSKYYILTKFANQQSAEYNFSNQFFGYKNKRKIYKHSSIEVQQLIPIILNHIEDIFNDQAVIYPKNRSYHYSKYGSISKEHIEDLEHEKLYSKIDTDDFIEEIEKAKSLLIYSDSGHFNFKISIEETDFIEYPIEKSSTDKSPWKST